MTGYVDLQVNGYGGVDFNGDALTGEELEGACARLRKDGVAGILATIITDEAGAMVRRLERVVKLREGSALAKEVIWGIHIEGPYMSPEAGYRGAHPAEAMKPTEVEVMKRFREACGGLLRVVTLAPEMDPGNRATAWLAKEGVKVSGGHSNASREQLRGAIGAGLSMWTHLGNGVPSQMHRHDNIIQRVLSFSEELDICFIGDGVHVPLFALGNYLKAANPERTIVVTDAVWPAGLGPGKFAMGRWGEITVGEDLAIWAPDRSHFLGSACTMPQCEANLRAMGLGEERIAGLLSGHARRVLGRK